MVKKYVLDFEKPIKALEEKMAELKEMGIQSGINLDDKISLLLNEAEVYKRQIYTNLTPIQKIQVARHPERPNFYDYVNLITTKWIELHGDRAGTDNRAMAGGIAEIAGRSVMLIGTVKGKSIKENLGSNFGMPHPEGYRKALRLFEHAAKFSMPIVTLIDTPGAYPGMDAEQTGQGRAIAYNLMKMASLPVPSISIVTGEGCSGGALGIGVTNRIYMLEHSLYTVISPEGCASILWRSADQADQAAQALKLTAADLYDMKIIDGIIQEPLGGAHNSYEEIAQSVKNTIVTSLRELIPLSGEEIVEDRYQKYRAIGDFTSL